MRKKYRIKKGDTVRVNAGSDRGRVGEVLKVFVRMEKVLVDGVNMVKKHNKPDDGGGIVNKSMPIHISNVSFMQGEKPTKIGYKVDSNGKKIRFGRKSGELID